MTDPDLSVLVLAFARPQETCQCLTSLRAHLKVPHKVVYLENGGCSSEAWALYSEGLCDVLIHKRRGQGGGTGQTDLFRWCDTPYAMLIQSDQYLAADIDEPHYRWMCQLLNEGYSTVDLNGDQSGRGVWTDRAHLIKTALFNSLGPFPNGGPGNDAAPWNEKHLQDEFARRGLKIAHLGVPPLFVDNGKWSVREAGDGLLKHRTDTLQLSVLRRPTYRTEVYPPLSDSEWQTMLAGQWVDGTIPDQWKPHSREVPAWRDTP